jgi:hypothetical protein
MLAAQHRKFMLQKLPGITHALWNSGWMLPAVHTSMTSASKPKRFNGMECVEWFVKLATS